MRKGALEYATYCNFFATIEICNILMHPYVYYFKLSISIKIFIIIINYNNFRGFFLFKLHSFFNSDRID